MCSSRQIRLSDIARSTTDPARCRGPHGVATVTLSTADDLAWLGTDFDMLLLRSAASHICGLEIKRHAGFDLDRTSQLDIGFEFPLTQGFLDVSPLRRRGAYHVNMLHTALRRHDHSHRDRYRLRADVI